MNTKIFLPIGLLLVGIAILLNQTYNIRIKNLINSFPITKGTIVSYSLEPIFSGHQSFMVNLPVVSISESKHPILLKFFGRANLVDVKNYSSTKTNIPIYFKYDSKENNGYIINNNISPGGNFPYYAIILCFMGITMLAGVFFKKI